MNEQKQDSFTVGTPATGGAVKVYFTVGIDSEQTIIDKIDFAIKMSNNAKLVKSRA